MIDDLQSLMDEILVKNDKYFPGWERMTLDRSREWTVDDFEELLNELMHVYWTNAMSGEAGELSNFSKKYMREALNWGGKRITKTQYREHTAEELADIFIYLVLYSKVLDIDLVNAIRIKVDINYQERFKVEDENGNELK